MDRAGKAAGVLIYLLVAIVVVSVGVALSRSGDSPRPSAARTTNATRAPQLDPRLREAARLDAKLSANARSVRRTLRCLRARHGDCSSLRALNRQAVAIKSRLDETCYRLTRKYGTMYTGPCAF
jgi:hypothetical protein